MEYLFYAGILILSPMVVKLVDRSYVQAKKSELGTDLKSVFAEEA